MSRKTVIVGLTLAFAACGCATSVRADLPMRWNVKTLTASVGQAVVYTPVDPKKYPDFGITVSSRPQGG